MKVLTTEFILVNPITHTPTASPPTMSVDQRPYEMVSIQTLPLKLILVSETGSNGEEGKGYSIETPPNTFLKINRKMRGMLLTVCGMDAEAALDLPLNPAERKEIVELFVAANPLVFRP